MPECFRPEGCPVEDLATDPILSKQVNQFLTAKTLYSATEDPRCQQKAFEELGLYDDPETHLELESVYSKWRQIKQNQNK